MRLITWLLIFAFWSFLRPFFKLELSNLVQFGTLNTLINISSGFRDNKKLHFRRFFMHIQTRLRPCWGWLFNSLIFMHGYLWKIWNRWGKIWWMNVHEIENVSTSPNFCKHVQCYFFLFFKELVNTVVWPQGQVIQTNVLWWYNRE